MLILRSQNKYIQLVELDTTSDTYRFFIEDPTQAGETKINGRYGEHDGYHLFFYRDNSNLFFRVNSQVIELNRYVSIYLESPNERQHRLVVFERGRKIVDIQYDRPIIDPPLSLDPTPFVSEEDYDFGLFVNNVVNDPERLSLVLSRW